METQADDFLLLTKEELKQKVSDAIPEDLEDTYFHVEPLTPESNPVYKEAKKYSGDHQRTHSRIVKIQTWVFPALILLPAGLGILFQYVNILPVPELFPPFWFVLSLMFTMVYFWFTGRIYRWRAKKFDANLTYIYTVAENLRHERASRWARTHYKLPKGTITWSVYSEFRLDDTEYDWVETGDDNWRLREVSTGEEVPQVT